jgi:hypothetical protein
MISLTLATALAVRVTGGAFFTSGTVVVAIRISLALKLFDYIRILISTLCLRVGTVENLSLFDAIRALKVARFRIP